ncbi:MAG: hypothetical protein M0Q93_00015 [Terrimicrobiaceae bacterium]|jgi:hypothetical protein|nr:hypothetical protein [Terrimicrobiaceae bacterium]
MNTESTSLAGGSRVKTIVIYHRNPAFGRMYLCEDGSMSSNRHEAAEHWGFQFKHIVKDNPMLRFNGRKVCAEIVR